MKIPVEKIFDLDNYNSIHKACQFALDNSHMVAILGYEGAGKTIALKKFSQNNRATQYVRVRPTMTTKDLYLEILGILSNRRQSLYEIMNDLKAKYQGDEKRLLILDEAGKISPYHLEFLHEFRDLTQDNLGIVIAGPEYFHDNLLEWKKAKIKGIPEFYRRIGLKIWLEIPKKKEIFAICEGYGIKDKKLIENRFCLHKNFSDLVNDIIKYISFENTP